jgi:integrase
MKISREEIENDPLMQQIIIRKKLKSNTISSYIQAFDHYCNLTGMMPSQLREEAYNDQKTIEDDLLWKINKYLTNFHKELNSKGYSEATINTFLTNIYAFYRAFKIKIPYPIEIKRVRRLKKESELIKIDHIQKVVNGTNNFKHKAIILLLATSGMRSGDMRNLTIEDFLEATKDYHETNDIERAIKAMEGKDVVPCWEFLSQKTKEHTITFNSPECTECIITYLKDDPFLHSSKYLFKNQYGDKYLRNGIVSVFKDLNRRTGLGSIKKENKDNKKLIYNYSFFHAHGLREFFATTLARNGVPYSLLKKMMGQAVLQVDHSYIHPDRKSCSEQYFKVLPYLSVRDTKVYDVKSEEYLNLERKLDESEKSKEEQNERIDKQNKRMDKMEKLIEEILS